jgi:hypothetical protein
VTLAILFWVLYIVSLVFGVWENRAAIVAWGHGFLFFVLIGILGWATFGAPVR